MAMKCTTCGGLLAYDIKSGKLLCEYCKTFIPIEKCTANNKATQENGTGYGYATDIYRCKLCGAELNAPEEQTVAYCAYCGGESVLVGKSEPTDEPGRIIPFSLSKNDACDIYKKSLLKKTLPSERIQRPEVY